jgi:predicted ribosome quality control (RQC) complex YloA/Tae2 family protein
MTLNAVLDALEVALRSYLRWYFFEREKILLLGESGRQLKSIRNRLKTYQARKSEMNNQRSFKEIGDLILGHAHSIRKGTSEALITDFFTGQRIRLKINPDLSAAENAEKCYKKAKNQGLEIAHLDQNIDALTAQLKVWENIETEALKAATPKDLRPYREFVPQLKGGGQKSIENQKPYKRLEYSGFEIWLGKNAKSNDALLKDAHKNDIWMHAADVSGSHVIIRNMGKPVAKSTLEAVASYCAFNSKGKSQTLQTVMYTERKMVSKAKNGLPGQVKVAKFQTIDVQPRNLSDFF